LPSGGYPVPIFACLKNGNRLELFDGIPPDELQLDREELTRFAQKIVETNKEIPEHVRQGALQGRKIWGKKGKKNG